MTVEWLRNSNWRVLYLLVAIAGAGMACLLGLAFTMTAVSHAGSYQNDEVFALLLVPSPTFIFAALSFYKRSAPESVLPFWLGLIPTLLLIVAVLASSSPDF